ncbi:MAG TPA: histidinol-phosphatase [Actinomycetes bacterium]|jgi:histidinol-phosphatase|nr:histidinol-phosphatase [Actinomycetes bacterium]
MHPDLAFAFELADLADAITLDRYLADDLVVETKPDRSPVTEADRAVEQALRKRIGEERPGHGVVGEEFGADQPGSTRWILDPIDGTKNYLRGVPVWATLIGLERDGAVVAGVVSAPALHRRWWAARGEGSFVNGRRIRVSRVTDLSDAVLSYASLGSWEQHGLGEQFLTLARACWRTRAFGDFWSHMLVAEGAADLAVEPEVNLWDLAAPQVIVEEAGGRFTDLGGTPTPAGGSVVSTNGLLHDRVLATLRP